MEYSFTVVEVLGVDDLVVSNGQGATLTFPVAELSRLINDGGMTEPIYQIYEIAKALKLEQVDLSNVGSVTSAINLVTY